MEPVPDGTEPNAEPEIAIRTATVADAAAVLRIYAPYVAGTAVSFEEEPPSVEEMAARIGHSHIWLVAAAGPEAIGYAYAAPFRDRAAYRWSAEVSIYLREDVRGRGVGTRLLREVLEGLRERGFVNAFAGTTLPNPASVALFASFGFRECGRQEAVGFKLGRWHDVAWLQLRLREPSVPPPPLG